MVEKDGGMGAEEGFISTSGQRRQAWARGSRRFHVGGGGQEHYVMEEAELGKVSHSSGQEVPALPSASSSQPTFPFTFRLVSLYFVPIAL